MKKISVILLVLVLIMVTFLTSCGKNGNENSNSNEQASNNASQTGSSQTQEVTEGVFDVVSSIKYGQSVELKISSDVNEILFKFNKKGNTGADLFTYTAKKNEVVNFVLDTTLLVYSDKELLQAHYDKVKLDKDMEYVITYEGKNIDVTASGVTDDYYIKNRGAFSLSNTKSNEISLDEIRGKKATFIGDSITYGYGLGSQSSRYSALIAENTGLKDHNMGINGTTLCEGGARTSRIPDAWTIPYDSDFVLVLLGVNDFDACSNKTGEVYYHLGEFESTDTSTIFGAAHKMYKILLDRFRFTETKIYIAPPMITSWNGSISFARDWSQKKLNACGYTLPMLRDAEMMVAEYYGLGVIDLLESGEIVEDDFPDGIHPLEGGHQKIAGIILSKFLENREYVIK